MWGWISLFPDEGKIWDCKQRGGALPQARGLGLRSQGVNALLCITRPGMTCHSRTRCKPSSAEVTNKKPMVLKSRGHMSAAGHSQVRAWGCFPAPSSCQGRRCSLGAVLTRRSSFHPATPGTAALGKMGAAAFKQSSCLFLKQLETAVRS